MPLPSHFSADFSSLSSASPCVDGLSNLTALQAPESECLSALSPNLHALMTAWRHLHAQIDPIKVHSTCLNSPAPLFSTMASSPSSAYSSPRSVLDLDTETPFSHISSISKITPLQCLNYTIPAAEAIKFAEDYLVHLPPTLTLTPPSIEELVVPSTHAAQMFPTDCHPAAVLLVSSSPAHTTGKSAEFGDMSTPSPQCDRIQLPQREFVPFRPP